MTIEDRNRAYKLHAPRTREEATAAAIEMADRGYSIATIAHILRTSTITVCEMIGPPDEVTL